MVSRCGLLLWYYTCDVRSEPGLHECQRPRGQFCSWFFRRVFTLAFGPLLNANPELLPWEIPLVVCGDRYCGMRLFCDRYPRKIRRSISWVSWRNLVSVNTLPISFVLVHLASDLSVDDGRAVGTWNVLTGKVLDYSNRGQNWGIFRVRNVSSCRNPIFTSYIQLRLPKGIPLCMGFL